VKEKGFGVTSRGIAVEDKKQDGVCEGISWPRLIKMLESQCGEEEQIAYLNVDTNFGITIFFEKKEKSV
jgi:hypothetical protein